jgi:TolB protein
MKRLLLAVALIFTAVSAFAEPASITVKKKARTNPTISFNGGAADAELAREVGKFLAVCGWFDMGQAGKSEYALTLRGEGGAVVADLSYAGKPFASWRFTRTASSRATAKLIVDTVIERSFRELKVRGFCNSRIAFCAETSPGIRNIYLCDIDGRSVEQLTNFRSLCVEPCWNPSGRSVFYSKYSRTGIDVLETTVGARKMTRVISGFRGLNTGAAVSPDGSKMAVILSFDHLVDLYVMEIGSRKLTRLTKGLAVEASPCWSPDGRQIAFVSDGGGQPRIYVTGVNGGKRMRLPTVGVDAVTPDWSTDGKIVFASRVGGAYTLGVYDFKTGNSTRVTTAPGSWESPAWAADNRQVVCKRTHLGRSGLFVVDTYTGQVRELLSTGYKLSMPAWSPCAQRH